MFCSTCGNPLAEDAKFCASCGTEVKSFNINTTESAETEPVIIEQPVPQPVQQQIITNNQKNCSDCNEETLPEKFKPLSPRGYLGYQLLFGIPFIGLVFLILFSFDDSNINRRNLARSYWCCYLVAAIICIVFLIFSLVLMGTVATTMRI